MRVRTDNSELSTTPLRVTLGILDAGTILEIAMQGTVPTRHSKQYLCKLLKKCS